MWTPVRRFLRAELEQIERELERIGMGTTADTESDEVLLALYEEYQRRRAMVRQFWACTPVMGATMNAIHQKIADTHMLLEELSQHQRVDVQDKLRHTLQIDLDYLQGLAARLEQALESARFTYALEDIERL